MSLYIFSLGYASYTKMPHFNKFSFCIQKDPPSASNGLANGKLTIIYIDLIFAL